MDYQVFLDNLADIVDMNATHALSFEIRRLNSKDRSELAQYLRTLAEDSQEKLNNTQ